MQTEADGGSFLLKLGRPFCPPRSSPMIPNAAKDGGAIRALLFIRDGAVNLVPFVDCCRIQRGGSGGGGGNALSGDKLHCRKLVQSSSCAAQTWLPVRWPDHFLLSSFRC